MAGDEKGGVASNKRAKFNFDEKMFKVAEGPRPELNVCLGMQSSHF